MIKTFLGQSHVHMTYLWIQVQKQSYIGFVFMDFVCVCLCAKCQNPFWIVFEKQVHRPFFSGPWYKRLKKGKTAKQNLYFENFHFFSEQMSGPVVQGSAGNVGSLVRIL